jgi:hypothetical protein
MKIIYRRKRYGDYTNPLKAKLGLKMANLYKKSVHASKETQHTSFQK